jgi:hypothetical protein
MTRVSRRLFAPLAVASIAVLSAVLAPVTAHAGPSCPTLGLPSQVERHILDKAGQGIDALRQYVWITRSVFQLDIHEVAAWVEAREQSPQCR